MRKKRAGVSGGACYNITNNKPPSPQEGREQGG